MLYNFFPEGSELGVNSAHQKYTKSEWIYTEKITFVSQQKGANIALSLPSLHFRSLSF